MTAKERSKHVRVNQVYAHKILFRDWETGEELMPYGKPTTDNEGNNIHIVCNASGTKFFKHTIRTEDINQIEAHKLNG